MVSLLILKHVRNLSDESVVEQWAENSYYQYFIGEDVFAAKQLCVSIELIEFRKHIGESGIELILKESIRINGKDGQAKDATTYTTVHEKNITFPTDSKLHKKILAHCKSIAAKENITLRQSYTHTIKGLTMLQRFRHHLQTHDISDDKNWYVRLIPEGTRSKVKVSNLTYDKTFNFRHKIVTKDGESDWEGPKPFLVK